MSAARQEIPALEGPEDVNEMITTSWILPTDRDPRWPACGRSALQGRVVTMMRAGDETELLDPYSKIGTSLAMTSSRMGAGRLSRRLACRAFRSSVRG